MGIVVSSGCIDYGVRKMEFMHEAKVGGFEAQSLIQNYRHCLAENGNGFHCFLFNLTSHYLLVDLVDDNDRCDYLFRGCGINDAIVLRGFGPVGETFYPAKAVNAYQNRSRSSRRFFVSRPLIIPLVERSGR